MSPIPPASHAIPHDLYLIITFASLAAFELSTAHLAAIGAAAKRSNKLLILVKIANSPVFAPPSATDDHQTSSSSSAGPRPAPGSSAAGSSSSQPQPGQLPTPLSHFKPIQRALSRIYSAATRKFLAQGRPLAKVEVVLEELRGLPFCIPAAAEVERLTVDDEHATTTTTDGSAEQTSSTERRELYGVAALGGTFDHLHAGHRILLSMAALVTAQGGRLVVGVSDASLLKNKKHADKLETLHARIQSCRAFLELVRPVITPDVVPIEDVYGPTATDETIEALVVSDETVAGGESINKLRQERKLGELDVWAIKLVADDGGDASTAEGGQVPVATKMGSTGIRAWLKAREEEGSGQV